MRKAPTDFGTFRDCPRKLAIKKLFSADYPVPENIQAMRARGKGNEGHNQLEMYLLHALVPTMECALVALPHLPTTPQPRDCIEWWFRVKDADGNTTMNGKADFLQFVEAGNYITDHKFVKTFRYCLTPQEMRIDPQCIIYAIIAAYFHPKGDPSKPTKVRLLNLKYSGAPTAMPVTTLFEPGEARTIYKRYLEPEELAIDRLALFKRPQDVPFNDRSCGKYKGCEYRDYCLAWGVDSYGEMSAALRPQIR